MENNYQSYSALSSPMLPTPPMAPPSNWKQRRGSSLLLSEKVLSTLTKSPSKPSSSSFALHPLRSGQIPANSENDKEKSSTTESHTESNNNIKQTHLYYNDKTIKSNSKVNNYSFKLPKNRPPSNPPSNPPPELPVEHSTPINSNYTIPNFTYRRISTNRLTNLKNDQINQYSPEKTNKNTLPQQYTPPFECGSPYPLPKIPPPSPPSPPSLSSSSSSLSISSDRDFFHLNTDPTKFKQNSTQINPKANNFNEKITKEDIHRRKKKISTSPSSAQQNERILILEDALKDGIAAMERLLSVCEGNAQSIENSKSHNNDNLPKQLSNRNKKNKKNLQLNELCNRLDSAYADYDCYRSRKALISKLIDQNTEEYQEEDLYKFLIDKLDEGITKLLIKTYEASPTPTHKYSSTNEAKFPILTPKAKVLPLSLFPKKSVSSQVKNKPLKDNVNNAADKYNSDSEGVSPRTTKKSPTNPLLKHKAFFFDNLYSDNSPSGASSNSYNWDSQSNNNTPSSIYTPVSKNYSPSFSGSPEKLSIKTQNQAKSTHANNPSSTNHQKYPSISGVLASPLSLASPKSKNKTPSTPKTSTSTNSELESDFELELERRHRKLQKHAFPLFKMPVTVTEQEQEQEREQEQEQEQVNKLRDRINNLKIKYDLKNEKKKDNFKFPSKKVSSTSKTNEIKYETTNDNMSTLATPGYGPGPRSPVTPGLDHYFSLGNGNVENKELFKALASSTTDPAPFVEWSRPFWLLRNLQHAISSSEYDAAALSNYNISKDGDQNLEKNSIPKCTSVLYNYKLKQGAYLTPRLFMPYLAWNVYCPKLSGHVGNMNVCVDIASVLIVLKSAYTSLFESRTVDAHDRFYAELKKLEIELLRARSKLQSLVSDSQVVSQNHDRTNPKEDYLNSSVNDQDIENKTDSSSTVLKNLEKKKWSKNSTLRNSFSCSAINSYAYDNSVPEKDYLRNGANNGTNDSEADAVNKANKSEKGNLTNSSSIRKVFKQVKRLSSIRSSTSNSSDNVYRSPIMHNTRSRAFSKSSIVSFGESFAHSSSHGLQKNKSLRRSRSLIGNHKLSNGGTNTVLSRLSTSPRLGPNGEYVSSLYVLVLQVDFMDELFINIQVAAMTSYRMKKKIARRLSSKSKKNMARDSDDFVKSGSWYAEKAEKILRQYGEPTSEQRILLQLYNDDELKQISSIIMQLVRFCADVCKIVLGDVLLLLEEYFKEYEGVSEI